MDGTYWFRARWYMIPEETAVGRQPHNLRRELYRTSEVADAEVTFVLFSTQQDLVAYHFDKLHQQNYVHHN